MVRYMEITTIPISKGTRDELKKLGHKNETYDDVIKNLLKISEIKKFYDEVEHILDTAEFVNLEKI